MNGSKVGIYKRFLKRPIDFILTLLAIIVLSPVLMVVALLVKTKLGSPVLFRQERPGLNEEIFMMYKFRTMTDQKDGNGDLLPDSVRLTKFGKLLRSTSLDELPELFNILKGDMSIIGPRPLLVQYLNLYNDEQKRRHEVRPGLSGLAQVSGRNAISWEEKFLCDVSYVDNITFMRDWKIIFLTLKKVFVREGINSETAATIEPFSGTRTKENNIKDKLLIIGASGHGKVVGEIALGMNRWKTISFLDDESSRKSPFGSRIIGTSKEFYKFIDDYDIIIGIGNNKVRQSLQAKLTKAGASIPVLIHNNAVIGLEVDLGEGTVVMAGAIVNCCTKIGKGCIINTGSTIDHDNIIQDFVHVSPGVHLAGSVEIGKGSWLGAGCIINNNLRIESDCIIGSGSVVIRDIIQKGTYVGVPVKKIE